MPTVKFRVLSLPFKVVFHRGCEGLPAMQETLDCRSRVFCNLAMQVQSLDQEDPLEKGMATHSSILAWRIPRTEEPGELQSMGLQRFGHN